MRRPVASVVTRAVLCIALLSGGCGDDGEGHGPAPTATAAPPTATAAPPTATAAPPTATSIPASPTAAPTATATVSDNPVLELPVDRTITLPGLPAPTDVAFDSLGVPHIYGPDIHSVLFVQGYETAKARFWEMDAFRRVAEGRLSELFGAITMATDVEMRTLFTTRDGRRLEQALWERLQAAHPDVAAQAQAYADGVNAWLADLRAGRNGATLPPEYTFFLINASPNDLAEWRPQDTLAIARLQAFSLSSTIEEELELAAVEQLVPEPIRRDVFRSAPAAPATVLPPRRAAAGRGALVLRPALPLPHVLLELSEIFRRLESWAAVAGPDRGSNNWIVAPSLSANGHALLANDPHLPLFNPPIWHMSQLDAGEGQRTMGVQFPGLPGIILGNNDHGAWGATTAYFDVTDIYIETVTTPPDYPASPRTVLFNGQQVPVLRIEEPIRLKGDVVVPAVIEIVPHHGPMLPDPNLDDTVTGLAATHMTLRWTGHEITDDARFIVDINRATNVEQFRAALRFFAVGAQNWVWADLTGDIAYFAHALLPQRPEGVVPYLPIDGTGGGEWLVDDNGNTAWVPEEKLPQAINPPQGFLASANSDQLGNTLDNDPLNDEIFLTFAADIGFRQQRIHDLLSNRNGERQSALMTPGDLAAYQYDTSSLEASRLLPFLFAAADNRPDLVDDTMSAALARLREWGEQKPASPPFQVASGVDPAEGRTDVPPRSEPISDEEKADAIASSVYAGFLTRLGRAVYGDEDLATGLPPGDFGMKGILHILEDIDRSDPAFMVHTRGTNGESTLWDDKNTPELVETRDEILLGALRDGLAFLSEKFGSSDPSAWLWGRIHQVRFQHFLGQAGIPAFDLGNFAAPGGRDTVNPAGFGLYSDNFVFSSGPSMRYVVDLDPNGIRAVNILPGGNHGNPGALDARVYNRINPEIHYGDHAPGWIDGETFEYRITRQAVADDTRLHVRYLPQ